MFSWCCCCCFHAPVSNLLLPFYFSRSLPHCCLRRFYSSGLVSWKQHQQKAQQLVKVDVRIETEGRHDCRLYTQTSSEVWFFVFVSPSSCAALNFLCLRSCKPVKSHLHPWYLAMPKHKYYVSSAPKLKKIFVFLN